VQFIAQVTPTFGTVEATGTVKFYDGTVSVGNLLGIGTLAT